jgi:hypothetical protein
MNWLFIRQDCRLKIDQCHKEIYSRIQETVLFLRHMVNEMKGGVLQVEEERILPNVEIKWEEEKEGVYEVDLTIKWGGEGRGILRGFLSERRGLGVDWEGVLEAQEEIWRERKRKIESYM